MNELRRPTRKTIIEGLHIRHVRRGDPFFPPDKLLKLLGEEQATEAWEIFTTTRTGLQPEKTNLQFVFSQHAADEIQANYTVGSEILSEFREIEQRYIDFVRENMNSDLLFGVCAGDGESPLALDILGDAEIHRERYGPISREVAEFIGKQRISELQEEFGENWQVAAAFEFCWLNLPHSSPAFVAASYRYHHYITGDDFSAGYHWRDLEIMVHRVEAEALKIIETRKRAGKSGSAKSSMARERRRINLFKKMETVAARSPDIVKLGADAIAKVALQECIEEDSALWRQGSGQVAEYLGEIRRGEAGSNMQERYQTLFGTKPPKRF